MNLYDILACPTCKKHLQIQENVLVCPSCHQTYPIINGIPVVFPNGELPEYQHEADLAVRDSYNPWVHRLILQSLCDDQVVVEVGAGNMGLDDPCIIRMDIMLSPYVDIVADVHALPFLPGSIDYIFSLAVFEHLRNPFLAAQSIYESLRDGGYIYHECNFVFAYHGYPHHYFNASMQGMEQIFEKFVPLRKGVATYQMPSFALDMVLRTYLNHTQAHKFPHGQPLVKLLKQVVDLDLMQYDIYFTEDEALRVAAGTYFAGIKKTTPSSTLIHPVICRIWSSDADLQSRFPDINDLTQPNNIMAWAFQEGRLKYPEVDRYLSSLTPFNKRGEANPWSRESIRSFPFEEACFGAIGFDPKKSMSANSEIALAAFPAKRSPDSSWRSMVRKAFHVLRTEGLRSLIVKSIRRLRR